MLRFDKEFPQNPDGRAVLSYVFDIAVNRGGYPIYQDHIFV